jgi:hypothetical protein
LKLELRLSYSVCMSDPCFKHICTNYVHHVCQFLENRSVIVIFIFCKRPCSFAEEGKMVCECVLATRFQRLNFNHLNPIGYVMHQQFNIQQLYALPTLYLCVYIYLRTNSGLCHLQNKLTGFYNRDEKCLQRGMDWVFK